ncbi:trypsin 3A1-like, partial [Rhopalosiphum maidis]|uniref:trypsin 3A1-like n=1 Tax=Rhopalosiphum maidis TaxID=43146 RepID=UPI000EFDB35E
MKGLIANGEQYDPIKFPYVVALKIFSENRQKNSICTGSLVKKLYVLTAAHCVHGSDKSLLEIESAFPGVKKYIEIGGKPTDFANHKALKCISIGFGLIDNTGEMGSSGFMITINVRHGETECKGYQSVQIKDTWQQYLCSEPTLPGRTKMTCPGDSGGPMICNNKLYGVCSFYINFEGGKNECGVPNMQTVHSFINYHLKWVNNILNKDDKKDDKKGDKKGDDKKDDDKKEDDKKDGEKKKKKKKKKKSSGNSIKP